MWLLSSAIAAGTFWPETRICTLVLGRLTLLTVPAPVSVQYRGTDAVPVSESVAVVFLLAAVSVAVTVPPVEGANCTVTVHVMPGPKPIPGHRWAVMVNSTDPDSAMVVLPDALPPVSASVNVSVAVWPTATCPSSHGERLKASTGGPPAAAGPAAATT